MKISGGKAVAEVMKKEGVKKVFCVPGESYLGVMDALYDYPDIKLVSARQEGGASFMAEGYAKASGEVGVCMATRGPGATNLSIGIHTASQDSTPLVALIGQVERPFKGREAFQEVELASFFSHLCKWTVEIDRAERIPELLHKAFHIARSGRPGPVLVALPQDMLDDMTEMTELHSYPLRAPQPDEVSVQQVIEELERAKQPVIIAGGGVIRSGATALLIQLAESLAIPVTTAFRRFDAFPNTHPYYIGALGIGAPAHLIEYIKNADVVVALGTRLSQITTQDYTLLGKEQRLIHVDISSDVFRKGYAPFLPVIADAKSFLQKILEHLKHQEHPQRKKTVEELHEKYMAYSSPQPDYSESFVDMEGMMHDLVNHLPKDAVITSDAGNFYGWLSRYYRFNYENTFIGPTSGAMGYGLPAAIGAKLAQPDKTVVSFSGDGGFMMTMQEMETAARYNIPVLSIVVNNNMYGTIRMHQERHFPERVIGTDLTNPHFGELAKLFGVHGERVERNADFIPALKRAISSGGPALIEVITNPKILSAFQEK